MDRIRWRHTLLIALGCLLGPALLALAAPTRFAGIISISTDSDGASAVANRFDTATTWSNASARLASFENAGTRKASIDTAGNLLFATSGAGISNSNNTVTIGMGTAHVELYATATVPFRPSTNLNNPLGTSSFVWTDVYSRHYASKQSAAPTCAIGTGAGTGGSPSCSCTGSDSFMECSLTTGSASFGVAGDTFFTVTFNTAFNANPFCVSSGNTNGATGGLYDSYLDRAAGSTTTLVYARGGTAPSGGSTYKWAIHCGDVP